MTRRKTMIVLAMLAGLAAAGILPPAPCAAAAKLDVTPSISLDQTYDSNVFNTDGNEKEDFLLRATPAITFSLKMPETTLNLRTSLTTDTYYRYTELNSTNSAVTLALDSQPPLALTPRLSIAPTGHFVQARDSFRRSQLVPSGDPLIPPSIAVEAATRKSRDYGAGLRASYLVTQSVDVTLGGGFTKRQFLDNAAGQSDSRVFTGDTSLRYKFTPLFSTGLFLNTSYNTFDNGVDSRVYAAGLTGAYRFSPAFTVEARAGASRAEEAGTVGVPERTTTSPHGTLSLVYFVDRDLRASLSGTFEQAGGGGFGRTTRRGTVLLAFTDRFAERWWADLSGNYQNNRSLDPAVSQNTDSASGTAGLRYQPWQWATVRLSGTASRQWAHGTVGTDLTRYSAFLGLTLGNTYNIY